MKRIISLSLCFVLLLFAAACKDKEKKSEHGVDIAYFADMGAMYESEFKISDKVPLDKEGGDQYFFTKAGSRSYFSNGEFAYYYDEREKEPEIEAIAAFSNCMGFEAGDISIEVTDALDGQEIEYITRQPQDGEIFFLPAAENREVLECKGLKRRLIFVFEDNALCAAFLEEMKYGTDNN